MSHLTITIQPVEGLALYCRYQAQCRPQPCYVTLDCRTAELSAAYSGEIGGGVPVDVWHHRAIRWHIPALRGDPAAALLEGLAPLAQRVVDGYSEIWDGSNHVGQLDDDAYSACAEIADRCVDAGDEDYDQISVWVAADWLDSASDAALGLTASSTDAELTAMAARIREDAAGEGVDVLEGLEQHLEYRRAQAQDAERGEE